MKKSTKAALITAGICIAAGIGFLIGGGISMSGLMLWDEANTERDVETVKYEFTDNIENVSVSEISGDVLLKVAEDGVCRVESMETDTERCIVFVENGMLTVRRQNTKKWFFTDLFHFMKCETVIWLPKEEYKALDLDTTSGKISVEGGFAFNDARIDSTSGSITISDFSAGELLAEVTSGKIELADVACGSAEVKTTSGAITLKNVAVGAGKVKAGSGAIRLDKLKAGSIDLETVSGSIKGSVIGPMVYHTDTTSGSISVPPADESGGEFRAETVSGSIKIERVE